MYNVTGRGTEELEEVRNPMEKSYIDEQQNIPQQIGLIE